MDLQAGCQVQKGFDFLVVVAQQLLFLKAMKPHHANFKQAQTTVEFLLGPIKIKDGLFMGDQFAAKDIEFIISNKVTHIINTVSKSIPNLYQRFGIQYLSVHWTEKEENIFDKKNNAVNAIFQFVEEAMEAGESCLIHSVHGKSRVCAVLAAYLMKKYNWSLNKCLEYINTKKEGLQIRNNYLLQMQELQKRMMNQTKLSVSWNQINNQDDLLLANTFYNAKKTELKGIQNQTPKKSNKKRITWNEKLVQKPVTVPAGNVKIKDQVDMAKKLKSILKGDQEEQFKSQKEQFQKVEKQPKNTQGFLGTINGNIVHVTVNNFINTQKKNNQQTPLKAYNMRPFSSDTKDREKKLVTAPTKMFPYDSSMSSNFKNPYENKIVGKIGTNIKAPKKKEEIRNPIIAYQRPISANTLQDKKKVVKPGIVSNPLNQKLGFDMSGSNSSVKKRFPSSNPKQDSFKWK